MVYETLSTGKVAANISSIAVVVRKGNQYRFLGKGTAWHKLSR